MSIRNFSILEKLGEGAYSSVYRVQRHADKTEYALKKVKLGGLSEKELQNAVNQVRILASIQCPNIISYKEAFLEGKSLCIIMEYANGGDLYQQIVEHKRKKQHFKEYEIWNCLIQVTRGLNVLHDLRIFHRDLKSANIFLTQNGQIKLGDMNVSKISKNGLLYTQTGTPYYASPEVWKDQPYDMKSDIWSFGCIIYEMATLQPPFKGEDMEGLYQSVIKGNFQPIPSLYSKQLAGVIRLMLQQNPTNRPTTDKLLKSSLILKKSQELNLSFDEDIHSSLLQTIRIPRKLHYLTDRLPKSNYESTIKYENGMFGPSKRMETENREKKLGKGSLPKLDNIIRYHEDLIKRKDSYGKIRNRNNSLEVVAKNHLLNPKGQQIHRIHHRPSPKYYDNHSLPPLRR